MRQTKLLMQELTARKSNEHTEQALFPLRNIKMPTLV